MTPSLPASPPNDRRFFIFNAVVTTAAVGLLTYLLMIRGGTPGSGLDLRFMPAVNAALNATSAVLLFIGWRFAKAGNARVHRLFMVAALVTSAVFLVCYLTYHSVHGDTKFQGAGFAKVAYLVMLASHVLGSMFVFPAALSAVYFAVTKQVARHTKLTRVLFPVWMYVSVTGVIIYFVLRGNGVTAS